MSFVSPVIISVSGYLSLMLFFFFKNGCTHIATILSTVPVDVDKMFLFFFGFEKYALKIPGELGYYFKSKEE
jgi:hypothetical protein